MQVFFKKVLGCIEMHDGPTIKVDSGLSARYKSIIPINNKALVPYKPCLFLCMNRKYNLNQHDDK